MRCNGPYEIAYSMGKADGEKHPEYTEQDIANAAARSASAMVSPFSTSATTRRYWRETGAAYIAGFSEGRGHIMTEDEWTAKFKHPSLVYRRMRFGHRLDRKPIS